MLKKGFTLIELLVVVAIIGFLATFTVFQLQSSREKAKLSAARADLMQIIKLIQTAQQETGQPLGVITSNYCSDCVCRLAGDLRKSTGTCYTTWQTTIGRINAATNGSMNISPNALLRDPWGSPYALDENEREAGPNDCTLDVIRSVGPDGIYDTSDDVNLGEEGSNTSIPWSKRCP